ncbi:hypothetical protein [Sneathiella sp. HT1-7]|uniref:hypothetical protein n=1 Tax=Sneathiella sp. HT1-7 TaxID=2887192 RepID=UPI001D14D87C|nr:hypothetical protein [Sneathiella sp. HT1-7]MCC3305335.1 hypothetical protein [Sneathiella sp. HT1-7]
MITIFTTIVSVLTIAVICDLLIARTSGKRLLGYMTSFVITLIGLPLVLVSVMTPIDIFAMVIALGIALMWWFIYLNLVQAVESSLRIRMLREIEAEGGSVDIDKLKLIYNDDRLIRIRLKRLEKGGAVILKNGRHHLNSGKLEKAAHFFTTLKRLLLNRRSQFDA